MRVRGWVLAASMAAYAAVVAVVLRGSHELAAAVAVGHVLVLIGVPLLLLAVRQERPNLRTIVIGAFVVRLFGALGSYFVVVDVYGSGDASTYHRHGDAIAEAIRSGLPVPLSGSLVGTNFIRLVTGIVYTVTSPTMLGGFFVFSFMGFFGLLLFYKAFRLAVPGGDERRYALLVLLLPSLLFWPSSIGKDAWMTLMLGVAAYGMARLLVGRPGSLPLIVAGLAGTAMVRPHVTLTLVIALGIAVMASRRVGGIVMPVLGRRLVPLLVVLAALGLVLGQTQEYFGVEELSAASVEATFEMTAERSTIGGSSFEPVSTRSPFEIPLAIFSVLFRPLVFEADNLQALLASLEGTFLLLLAIGSWPRLRGLPAAVRANSYVGLAFAYTFLFCIAFSNLGNFGIIARQRVQLLPFALVLLALPVATPKGRARVQTGEQRPEPVSVSRT